MLENPRCGNSRVPIVELLAICVLLPALLVDGAGAGPWQGAVEIRDGVEYVMNPTEPMEAPATIVLQEEWRIGGDSEAEGEFFGVIRQIRLGQDRDVYLLDEQLSEVKVFSRDGEYLRTIGRQGEGPGEFIRPGDMFFLPDGNLGVMQFAPGRIALLSPVGEPMSDHPLPELEGGVTPFLVNGQTMGNHLLLELNENTPFEGRVDINRFLALVGSDGLEKKRILESHRQFEFEGFHLQEQDWANFDDRWQVALDGRLFVCVTFQDYAITMWDVDGTKQRVITREYDHLKRTRDQKDEVYDIFDAYLQDQLPEYSIGVSENDADIANIFPREDGTLWVMSSRGMRLRPEGAIGVFDVFDRDGRYVRQVTLMGEGDPLNDGVFFLGDRIFVVTDLLDADLATHGGRRGEEAEIEEAEPIEVICYSLGGESARAAK